MPHTVLVVDSHGGESFERVSRAAGRLGLTPHRCRTARSARHYLATSRSDQPRLLVVSGKSKGNLAVAEEVQRVVPGVHVLFIADFHVANEINEHFHDSPVLRGACWVLSPPDEERIGEFLTCALKRRCDGPEAARKGPVREEVDAAGDWALGDRFPQMMWAADGQGVIDYHNAEWGRVFGIPRDRLQREGWLVLVHPEDQSRVLTAWRQAVADSTGFSVEARLGATEDQWRWCGLWAQRAPVGPEGVRWYGVCAILPGPAGRASGVDVLAEVTRRVTENLDYESTLAGLAQAVVPAFADWCAVDVVNESGGLDRSSLAHSDPVLVKRILERRPDAEVSRWAAEHVARTGETQIITHVDQALIDSVLKDPKDRAFIATLQLRSLMRLPLKARGRTVGVITFVLAGAGSRRYTEDDLPLATEIARQGAIAVENARLYRKAREEIEERRHAEEALALSEARYRSLIEASAQIVWGLDTQGRARDDMSGWRAFTGQGLTEIEGHGWMRALRAPDAEHLMMQLADAPHPITVEVDLAHREGTYRRVVLRLLPLFDQAGQCREWIAAGTDVTSEKSAADLLAREKEQLAVTLNSLGEAVVTVDNEGHIRLFNRVAQSLTGWPAAEVLGRSLDEVLRLEDVSSETPIAAPEAHLLRPDDHGPPDDRLLLRARDGSRRLVIHTAAPIRDAHSRVTGAVIVFRDVTAQQKLEEDFLKAQKLESVGVLAGGIAHDFNNILTAVIGNIALAKMFTAGGDRVSHALSEAEKAAWRARGLTQQLLTFAKGGAPVKREASLGDLLRETVPFALAGSNVKCTMSIADDLWPLAFDPGQLAQAINNLVINAAQAMPQGGIISIAACNHEVAGPDTVAIAAGSYVHLTIQDEGVGIARAHLDKIFDPYFTTKEGRTGLGLATTYSIIRRHDGVIRVQSEEGRGARFEIFLPASQATRGGAAAPEQRGSGRILVMDDEPVLRTALTTLLTHLGYETEAVAEGGEALVCYEEARRAGHPFVAVILDLSVATGLGGKECLRELQALDPQVRAIASSGYHNDPIMTDFARFGFRAAIVKPYQLRELEEVVRQVVLENGDRLR